MIEFLLLVECILLAIILVVLLQKKDNKLLEPIAEVTEKVRQKVKAYGKKEKHKPRVNDDLHAFKIENDI